MHIVSPQINEEAQNDNNTIQQLNKLAYAVSHDMGASLRHVKGFTELLERDISDKLDDRSENHLNHLKTATNKLDTMMEGVLQYSRIATRGQPKQHIDSAEVVSDVIGELIESKVRIPLITHNNLPSIDADPEQFKNIWRELINNAITYTPDNKLIEISITCNKSNDKWIFTIADKGMGMPTNITKRIFTMFYRGVLEEDYPTGNGIGLSLCEKIIQRHGGTIWCESEENVGSRFHFTWPIYEWRDNLNKLNEDSTD